MIRVRMMKGRIRSDGREGIIAGAGDDQLFKTQRNLKKNSKTHPIKTSTNWRRRRQVKLIVSRTGIQNSPVLLRVGEGGPGFTLGRNTHAK